EIVAAGGKPLPAPIAVDIAKLPQGAPLPATPAGADALQRAVYVSPAGVFTLPAPEAAELPRSTAEPAPLTLRVVSAGTEIQAEIVAAGATPLDEPVPVNLARVTPGLTFTAIPNGSDEQGHPVLATPVGSFIALDPPPKDATVLTLRIA